MKRLLVAMLLLATPAQGQDNSGLLTGNGYLAACTADDPISPAICMQYTLGMDNMLLRLQLGGYTKALECSPDQTTGRQKKDVFVAWLKEHPALRHLMSAGLYLMALQAAWPCPPDRALPPVDKKM